MSGDGNSYYFGDAVNIQGGTGHQGIVHNHAAPAQPPTLEEALRTVVALMQGLRAEVAPEDRQSFDDALPVLAADATDAAVEAPVRRRALLTVAGIAAMLGTLGAPLLDSARAALELLGVGG
ncbi:hypothetical protein GCM10010230_31870 [Streptomyces narbonensis]|uniref:hypothetical protein n=1 Tax=Streptomyces narbonensis TaxID=67333 RepID=UPI00167B7922|nr:hypothetical protein [Streptomyces narbonensis]GGW01448.1 hypothetical protein GCM10010230_31870 [Streptomyces narbonensis]